MPNRLASETSPYLLQHADNPVQWYPWGEEAFALARRHEKPIFLSIGYSACHWCHVMAHESFEDTEVARVLNEHFVSIKVDREERPEVDQVYMEAVQMMTGGGGWPLSVFLTPGLEPFFGGTYFPPRARGPMPGFRQVLLAVVDLWKHRRPQAIEQGRELARLLAENDRLGSPRPREALGEHLLRAAEEALSRAFDPKYGGFSAAPKFPHPMHLRLLLRRWHRSGRESLLDMVRLTLDRMAAGGIYDQLGGGFHRYSTDAQWLVPHFEKMLYDNALLAACYVEAWQATGDPLHARVARETLDYVLRDMSCPDGGFASSEDADSEGFEGGFYLWSPQEIRSALGAEAARRFAFVYGVTEAGHFEGGSILHRPNSIARCAQVLGCDAGELEAELADKRSRLRQRRDARPRPPRDDKVIASWNGLMIEALAGAGMAFGEPRYTSAAADAADFLLARLRDADGRLMHVWRQGQARFLAYLEDYASLANALVTLYEAQFNERWIEEAVDLADQMLRRFADPEQGGFYATAPDHHAPVVRKKDVLDSSVPSGGGLAATALLRLGRLCGRDDYLAAAEAALRAALPVIERWPMATGQLLLALDAYLGPAPEIVILGSTDGEADRDVLAALYRRYLPNRVVAFRDGGSSAPDRGGALSAIFRGKAAIPPGPTVFLCERFACQAPVSGKDAALRAWSDLTRTASAGR